MSNNEHCNTVDWSQIPEDVEAVVTFEHMTPNYYKVVDNTLMIRDSKNTEWESSFYSKDLKVQGTFGNRFHLRPTPSTQPTPEPPESTQVESSQVEDTSVPEFDWSTVEDDVEAVFIFENGTQKYKVIDSVLMYNRGDGYKRSSHEFLGERVASAQKCCTTYYIRPPATPLLDKVDESSVPSIQSILSDAQELIKKHHSITGEVKFTIKCS